MKRFRFVAIAVLIFALLLAGCSDSSEHKSDTTTIKTSRPSDVTEKTPETESGAVDKPKDAAIKTLETFHRDITDHRLSQAYSHLTKDFQDFMGYDDWARGFDTTVSSSVSDVSVEYESDDRVILRYVLTAIDNPGGTAKFLGEAVVLRVENDWKIDEITNKPMARQVDVPDLLDVGRANVRRVDVERLRGTTWGDYDSYTYECSVDIGKALKNEYVMLLMGEYPFQVMGSYKAGRTFETVLFKYTGSKKVSTFADADYEGGKIHKCNLLVAIDNNYERGRAQIFINLAPELNYGGSR